MTKHEQELRKVEEKIRLGKKVETAEVEHLHRQREIERERAERTKRLPTITLQWMDGEPKKWEGASCVAEIGGQNYMLEIAPFEEHDGKQRLRPKLVKLGYQGYAQDWAMWKWHTARGSEVDDATGEYILDCDAPEIVWQETVEPEPKKRGRPRKEEVAI